MKRMLGIVFLLCLLVASPATAAQVNKVAAVVNGKVITMFDLQRYALPELAKQRLNPLNPQQQEKSDVVLRRTLDMMIFDILLEGEAKRLGVKISESDIDRSITAMYRSRGMTKQQFESTLAQQKVSLSDIRENCRRSMIRERILGMEVGRRVMVRTEDMRKYYEEHKATMFNRRGLHMQLIVYHPKAPAAEMARKLRSGELSWLDVSKRVSVLPSRDKGGDCGEVQWDKLNKEWRGRLETMQPGDITPLFNFNAQLKAQVRLVRADGSKEPLKLMTFDEARPLINEILRAPKMKQRQDEYERQLRANALIDIRM